MFKLYICRLNLLNYLTDLIPFSKYRCWSSRNIKRAASTCRGIKVTNILYILKKKIVVFRKYKHLIRKLFKNKGNI